MVKYNDSRLQEISDDLELDKRMEKIRTVTVPLMKRELEKLNDKKFYKWVRQDFELLIKCFEDDETLSKIGFQQFDEINNRLEKAWVFSKELYYTLNPLPPNALKLEAQEKEKLTSKSNLESFKSRFPIMKKIADRIKQIF